MENGYDAEHYLLDEIRIRQILFDESDGVTIFGALGAKDDYETSISWDFICNFGLLTDILMFADNREEGDLLINIISEKLSKELEIPTVIDMDDIFGGELYFTKLIFEVYKPHEKDENGIWQPTDENCYFIESIESQTEFYKRNRDNKEETKPNINEDALERALSVLGISKSPEDQLSDYFIILHNAYRYYSQLIGKDFTEKEARRRAGLSDELLFRISILNNQIITQNAAQDED